MCYYYLTCCGRNKFLISIIIILLSSFIIQIILNLLYPSVILLTDIHKCPACYGTTACINVFNNNITIKPFDIHSTLSHLFFSKNVFYGTMGEAKIVIKKLAHNIELDAFDNTLCDNIELRQLCWRNKNNTDKNNHKNINYNSSIESAVSLNFSNDYTNGLILCPTAKHFEKIINQSLNNNFNNTANLWTIIKINPEPIILTILSSDDGWPVPKYYGACGRIIIESYVGLPLTLYYNEPWLRRAKIAIYLLEAAQMFTFGSDDYAFYLTDISDDNIAIDYYDKPKFIDLENIFILDKHPMAADQTNDWYDLHVSDNEIECDNCFIFSPRDICSHHMSDHNYYAICQHILYFRKSTSAMSEGFLHNIPDNILIKYSKLQILLNECANPTIEQSRISAGDKLQKILRKIVEEEK